MLKNKYFFSEINVFFVIRGQWHKCVIELEVQLSPREIEFTTQVQILDKAICVFHGDNALGKGMNPTVLQAKGK